MLIAKWYPYPEDQQFGVFIQKHAKAIAMENKVVVLFAHSIRDLPKSYQIAVTKNDNLLEVIISFRKDDSVFADLINGFRYFIAIKKGVRESRAFFAKPDLIHAYILLRTAVVAYYYRIINRIPYIINEQWSGYATGKFSTENFFKKALTKFLVKRSSGLISVSHFLLDKMHICGIKHPVEKVIPNAVEVVNTEFYERTEKKVRVLLVADLVDEIKNISAVIKATAKIREPYPEFELRIIGQGKDKEKLVELSRELGVLNSVVIFEGLKTNPEVYNYLKRCDFLVMNSRFETFSLICGEALSCGKPVLATRCGGPQEFIDAESGVLIEVDNDAELAEKFQFMLENFNQFDSHKIISKVKHRFSRETVKNLYSDFFQEVFGS